MIRPSFSLLSCRKMKINLRQTKNHSAEIDFSFGAEKSASYAERFPVLYKARLKQG